MILSLGQFNVVSQSPSRRTVKRRFIVGTRFYSLRTFENKWNRRANANHKNTRTNSKCRSRQDSTTECWTVCISQNGPGVYSGLQPHMNSFVRSIRTHVCICVVVYGSMVLGWTTISLVQMRVWGMCMRCSIPDFRVSNDGCTDSTGCAFIRPLMIMCVSLGWENWWLNVNVFGESGCTTETFNYDSVGPGVTGLELCNVAGFWLPVGEVDIPLLIM